MQKNVKLVIIISLAIIISSIILGVFFYQTKKPQNTIRVVGISSQKFTADTVKWSITLEENVGLNQIKEGYKNLEVSTSKLMNIFQSIGIESENINLKPINVYYEYGKDGINGYRIQQYLFIISNNIKEIETLALNPVNLLEKNILIQNSRLEYFYSKIDDLKKEIIADATVNATERANKMLENTDMKLGKLVSLNSGVFQITEPYSTSVSSSGIYDTSTKNKQIKVTVHAKFELK